MKKEAEFYIGDGQHLTMKTTYTVEMQDKLRLLSGDGKGQDLNITISVKKDLRNMAAVLGLGLKQGICL